MTGSRLAWEVALLLLGATGLFSGLSRLTTAPLSGVLVIVSAMAFLLLPTARLCGAEVLTNRRRK
jgi:hypothetical protein